MFQGKALKVSLLPDGIAELTFDLQGESVNKFSLLVVSELQQVLDLLEKATDIKGLLIKRCLYRGCRYYGVRSSLCLWR